MKHEVVRMNVFQSGSKKNGLDNNGQGADVVTRLDTHNEIVSLFHRGGEDLCKSNAMDRSTLF